MLRLKGVGGVADIVGFGGVDDVFDNVLGVVADTLEMAGDEDQVHEIGDAVGLGGHGEGEVVGKIVVHLIDVAIARVQGAGAREIAISKGAHAGAEDFAGFAKERGEGTGGGKFGLMVQGAGAARDLDGLIANAFDVVPDFHGGNDLAQIGGDGLETEEHFDAVLVDLFFEGVDFVFVSNGDGALLGVALKQAVHGVSEIALSQAGHHEDIGAERFEDFVESVQDVFAAQHGINQIGR